MSTVVAWSHLTTSSSPTTSTISIGIAVAFILDSAFFVALEVLAAGGLAAATTGAGASLRRGMADAMGAHDPHHVV
eukprot:6060308-Pleurochrysis_carterae.AAC.1